MIARLEEQKLLLNDPNYIRTSRTWVKKNGELTPIDRQQRVLPWWRVNADGSYVFFVRLGSKPIEFEKGKNAVAVPSLDKMPLVINILITAVRNGELDEQLAQTKPLRIDKSPNAAIRDYLSDSKPRMHSFGTVWWSSCLRFKRCTMVPNSSCRHLTDFDDDTLAKTWLHDVNTTPMKFSERTPNHLSGCPFRPVTLKKVVSGHSLRA